MLFNNAVEISTAVGRMGGYLLAASADQRPRTAFTVLLLALRWDQEVRRSAVTSSKPLTSAEMESAATRSAQRGKSSLDSGFG